MDGYVKELLSFKIYAILDTAFLNNPTDESLALGGIEWQEWSA